MADISKDYSVDNETSNDEGLGSLFSKDNPLSSLIDSIKSGSWASGKAGDIIESTLQGLSRAAPFPGVIKALTGQDTSQYGTQGGVLNPLPEIITDPMSRALEGIRQSKFDFPGIGTGKDVAKFIEDSMGVLPFHGSSLKGALPFEASPLRKTLASEAGVLKPTPIVDSVLEAITPSKKATQITKPIEPETSPLASRLKSLFSEDVTSKDLGRGIIREEAGKTYGQSTRELSSLIEDVSRWAIKSKPQSLDFWEKMEQPGQSKNIVNPKDRAAALETENILLRKKNTIIDRSEREGRDYFQAFVKNYYPHMFSDSEKASSFFDRLLTQQSISEGSKAFLHERVNPDITLNQAIQAGHEPVTWNPIEMPMLKAQEMDRFELAHNIKDKLIDSGIAVDMTKGEEKVPKDWLRLDDSLWAGGKYYAPADVAKDFNKFFSPGLSGSSPIYDAIRGVASDVVRARLGLSGFHMLFSMENTNVMNTALALEQATQGKIGEATLNAAKNATKLWNPVEYYDIGRKVNKEFLHPGSYPQYEQTVKNVELANGRIGTSPINFNRSINAYRSAIHSGDFKEAAAQSIRAFFEWSSKPLMEEYVPKVKLGAFHKLESNLMERAAKEGWTDVSLRREIQRTWDSIDNLFGQLNHPNLFWHKVSTDVATIGLQAPGWQIGTVKTLGGGLIDLGTQAGRLLAERKFNLTHRMAVAGSMIGSTMYTGALITLAMRTAQGKSGMALLPHGVDYLYPPDGTTDKNGNENRMRLPGYGNDVMGMTHHPLSTVFAKLNPVLTAPYEMLINKDFNNTEIFSSPDFSNLSSTAMSAAQASAEMAKFLAKQMTPFSLHNYQTRAERNDDHSLGLLIQSFAGLGPANREYVKTDAENLVTKFLSSKFPSTKTQEEAQKIQVRGDLENSFRKDQIGVGDLVRAVGKGQLTKAQLESIIKYKNLPTIVRDIQYLDADQAFKVYQLANSKEKVVLKSEVIKSITDKMRKENDLEKRQSWLDKLLSLSQEGKVGY